MKTTASDNEEPSAGSSNRLTAAEIKSMWNLGKVMKNLGRSDQCVKFAEDHHLIKRSRLCSGHRSPMTLSKGGHSVLGAFECHKRTCRGKRISRAKGTWFENAKISLPHIFYLMYCYAHHWPQEMVRLENFIEGPNFSTRTITDWYNFCREVVVSYQIEKQDAVDKIGGVGKKVQIDEIKFGKRKPSKHSNAIEGHWLLGMIADDSEDLRLEICQDKVRSVNVLLPFIKKHVKEGTIIRADFWEDADCLADTGFKFEKVTYNDSDKLLKGTDGKQIQRIDAQWRVVKHFYYRDNFNNPANFADMIVEYLWRKSITRKHEDPFVKLIEAIQYSFGQ
ncbi:uncharacterized protein LOC118748851 [Rhagoletis pomonella]|uniref:uncharacterized protein LOC118748851 n=1 Tax=Rhagoletis pomonella TaxID=28610 RepID=UPI00177C0E3F|nr:uncharacterized protein LOC118748851 [Rhagoletis pomonella]